MSGQSRFDARYWMLGAGALGRPRGMVWGGRREEGSRWGTHVYLWQIHFDIWQNQYNIVKLKKEKKATALKKGKIVYLLFKSQSRVWLFVTPWAVAHQAPLSVRFPRQEYCSGFPFSSAGYLPGPGIEPASPALAGGFFTTEPPGKPSILFSSNVSIWTLKNCCYGWSDAFITTRSRLSFIF